MLTFCALFRYHLSKHNTVLTSTGSTFIWAMFMRWDNEAHPVSLIPAEDWGKCSVCASRQPSAHVSSAGEVRGQPIVSTVTSNLVATTTKRKLGTDLSTMLGGEAGVVAIEPSLITHEAKKDLPRSQYDSEMKQQGVQGRPFPGARLHQQPDEVLDELELRPERRTMPLDLHLGVEETSLDSLAVPRSIAGLSIVQEPLRSVKFERLAAQMTSTQLQLEGQHNQIWGQHNQQQETPRWACPFTHGLGSSWHSVDSSAVLWIFCRLDWLLVGASSIIIFLRTYSCCYAAGAAFILAILSWAQGTIGLNLFVGLVCRPWIWLIMA